MAAELKKELGAEAELEVGSSGELSVWVDGVKVIDKAGGAFPEPPAVLAAVRAAST